MIIKNIPSHIKPVKVLQSNEINHISTDFDLENTTKEEIENLGYTLAKTCIKEGGVGLAASQIGVYKRAFVVRNDLVFALQINPTWTPLGEEKCLVQEGCLSVKNKLYAVERYKKIVASWHSFENNEFKKYEMILEGYKAQIFQHETSHGELITINMVGKEIKLNRKERRIVAGKK